MAAVTKGIFHTPLSLIGGKERERGRERAGERRGGNRVRET
jgi:hypothetical protein